MIRVLVVEDEPIAADAHAMYVERVPGFTVAAKTGTAAEALRLLVKERVDLVLLDLNLPDMHGMDVVRAMRAAGHPADVMAVTSARDLDVVRAAVSQGIVHYLLKPFAFPALRDKLERYRQYRSQLDRAESVADQNEVDVLLATLRGQSPTHLPKGMSPESLSAVADLIRAAAGGLSAAEVALSLHASRVTARRYLEYLAERGAAARHLRYGNAGRPEVEYRWIP
ncbi:MULTISPECIES: response regulator [Dactylosporangium]|uniref:Transcriptional regulatory protein n=2 Tax=Dactylosporangium TaxID=35753 RepID=A0A9W6KQW6_9ACTN|nr:MULTISPECIES: response regulator [Dactylosporangium]UAB92270.1 response regulator [Dactylosporangium vinaceum]UWZ49109.1 response regulator [Dactylosporangium matsuzakiense]GLL06511.1 transcriptional regulatory protein [Dactylosporangium matsuzakiense]